MKDDVVGFLIILGIIAISLYGGIGNSEKASQSPTKPVVVQTKEEKIKTTEKQIDELKQQVKNEEDKKNKSEYADIVTLSSLYKSNNPDLEHITIKVSTGAKVNIPVTGWTLTSTMGGITVAIPKGNYLFFAGMPNSEENIILSEGDVMYVVTGYSPIGISFQTNKCSGYLDQFQKFTPYLKSECPRPKDEDLSSIPDTVNNYDCLNYINSFPRCKISTKELPRTWSYECTSFIKDKINYPSCISVHKNDPDFYKNEWRVYLKRSEPVWNFKKQIITLYDNKGKVVDTIKY